MVNKKPIKYKTKGDWNFFRSSYGLSIMPTTYMWQQKISKQKMENTVKLGYNELGYKELGYNEQKYLFGWFRSFLC